jgi:O-antigen ligase
MKVLSVNVIEKGSRPEFFRLGDSVSNRISFWHMLLFLAFLPFDRFYSEVVLISFCIHTAIHIRSFEGLQRKLPKILLLQSFYLLTLYGTMYTINKSQAFSDLGRLLAILLFPLIFAVNKINLKRYRSLLMTGFALVNTLTILYLFVHAILVIRYNHMPFASLFTPFFINHNFSEPIDMHATYLSLFVALSLVYMFDVFMQGRKVKSKSLPFVSMMILAAGLVQLGSKSVIFALIIIANIIIPFYYVKKASRARVFISTVSTTILFIIAIASFDNYQRRFIGGLKSDLEISQVGNATADPRLARWELALDIIKRSPVVGFGSGDEVDLLKEAYFNQRLYTSYLHHLNTHNQYLAVALKFGAVGLVVFLFTLLYGFILAIRRKDLLMLAFMILVSVVCMSENILDVNKGIFFYAFFFSYFLIEESQKKRSQHMQKYYKKWQPGRFYTRIS